MHFNPYICHPIPHLRGKIGFAFEAHTGDTASLRGINRSVPIELMLNEWGLIKWDRYLLQLAKQDWERQDDVCGHQERLGW